MIDMILKLVFLAAAVMLVTAAVVFIVTKKLNAFWRGVGIGAFLIAGGCAAFLLITANTLYENTVFGFSYRIPKSWDGKYILVEYESSISFVHKETRAVYGEGTGLLFSVNRLFGEMTKEQAEDQPWPAHFVAAENGFTYVVSRPGDIQYPAWESGDKTIANNYLKLERSVDKVVNSVGVLSAVRLESLHSFPGTAVVTENTNIIFDFYDMTKTKVGKNTLVYVSYNQDTEYYYVQTSSAGEPPVHGYIEKSDVSFDFNDISKAKQCVVTNAKIYHFANDRDLLDKDFSGTVNIVRRNGDWICVRIKQADAWVKASDVSYELIPTDVNLKHSDLQRLADDDEEEWRVNSFAVARDFLFNTLGKTEGEIERGAEDGIASTVGRFTYTYIDPDGNRLDVPVYQPVKKDRSGIWVVDEAVVRTLQIENAISYEESLVPDNGVSRNITVTSGMGYYDPWLEAEPGLITPSLLLEFDFSEHEGKTLELAEYWAKDFEGNITPYIFIFEGERLLGRKAMWDEENAEAVRRMLEVFSEE